MTLDPATVERFRRDLEAITGESPAPDRKLALAVSGGPDSLALLLLAHAAYPHAIVAATVDHRLRPESAGEAAFVAALCAARGIPHETLAPPDDAIFEGNMQEQARAMRYALLHDWAGGPRPWRAEWVATAHQQDDVAEGFLMRARRGSGVGGLAEMAARRPVCPLPGPQLIRPLLQWSRAELAHIVAAAGIKPVNDPSNLHPRFDRSRIRALLAASPDLPVAQLAMAARNLRHAEDALDWMAEREWEYRHEIGDDGTLWLEAADLPYELRRRLVLRAIEAVRSRFDMHGLWRGAGVDSLIAACDAGRASTLACVAVRPGRRWRFTQAPPRRSH